MPVQLDHLIVPSKNRVAAAKLLSELLGVPWAEQGPVGPFSPAYVNDGLTLDFDEWTRAPGHLLDVALVLLGIVAYILLSDILGFLLASTGLLTLWMARFRGGKWVSSLGMAIVASLAIDYAFRKILLVPLPLGPFVGVMW